MASSSNDNSVFRDLGLDPRADLAAIDAALARIKNDERAQWRSLAGPHFESLLTDRTFCENCLSSPDSNLRLVSISILSRHWKAGPDIGSELQRMVLLDP